MSTIIQVGDRVRSYDFRGVPDCFIEGTVERIGTMPADTTCQRYHIKVERTVWDGDDLHKSAWSPYVYPPVNGTPAIFGNTNGVEKIA